MQTVHTIATLGVQPIPVHIECTATSGIPEIILVGLADKTIIEAKDRVVTALKHCGVKIKARKIVINLQPAHLKKSGSYYDLAIAVGLLNLLHDSQIPVKDTVFLGELSLDGSLQPISHIITKVHAAKELGYTTIFVPQQNSAEAAQVSGVTVKKLHSISQLLNTKALQAIPTLKHSKPIARLVPSDTVFDSLEQQEHIKRAVMLAIAGHHHLLVVGPPGVGKTTILQAASSLVPPLTESALLESLQIYEAAEETPIKITPIRNPSSQSTFTQLFGNSKAIRPGEVSLAHNGILFFDEVTQFSSKALTQLRKILDEKKSVLLTRTDTVAFPAHFLLLAATNPCPCGYWQTNIRACKCSQAQRVAFEKKLPGPLLDRVDMKINSFSTTHDMGAKDDTRLSAHEARTLISHAHHLQKNRYQHTGLRRNADLRLDNYVKHCDLNIEADKVLSKAITRYQLSYRAIEKVIAVAQTIADISNQRTILPEHIQEALSYRFELHWTRSLG